MDNKTLTIGEVVKLSGLPASTLRFYEEKGLIKPIGRKGLKRIYDAGVIERVAVILLGRNVGYTLDEVTKMLKPDDFKIDKQQLSDQADKIEKTIKQLTAMVKGLRHAAECPAPSHFECCKFQQVLRIVITKVSEFILPSNKVAQH